MHKFPESKVTKALRLAVKRLKTMTPEERVALLVKSGSLRPEEAPAALERLTKASVTRA